MRKDYLYCAIMNRPKFDIKLLDEAMAFLRMQDASVREKILYNADKARFANDSVLLKKLRDDIWEFRTFYSGKQYRLFAFWSKENGADVLVVATHGIIKKTDKVPEKEIKKAIAIRKQYLSL